MFIEREEYCKRATACKFNIHLVMYEIKHTFNSFFEQKFYLAQYFLDHEKYFLPCALFPANLNVIITLEKEYFRYKI